MMPERPSDNRQALWMLLLVLSSVLALPETAFPRSPFTSYGSRSQLLPRSPASQVAGLNGFVNPASLTHLEEAETVFSWTGGEGSGKDWGLFTAVPHLGFGMLRQEIGDDHLNEYRLALAGGDRSVSSGLAFGWASGGTTEIRPQRLFALGTIVRPSPYLSLGLTMTSTYSLSAREGLVDAAFRPLGSDRLTMYADLATANDRAGGASFWSMGASLSAMAGVRISAQLLDDRTAGVGLDIDLGRLGLLTRTRHTRVRGASDRTRSLHAVRIGTLRPNALGILDRKPPRYLKLDLFGPVKHRRSSLFDRSRTLLDLQRTLARATADAAIGGVLINMSGMRVDWESSWELRESLRRFREAGKTVVIYLDVVGLRQYHFASVADRIVMDPAGYLALEGFVAGRTYLRGALDKLGIGSEEWRFFEYKSAFETLTRKDMSEADRRQSQQLIDDFYEFARTEITGSRGIAPEEFDRLVDDVTFFLPQAALESGLIDSLGRWESEDQLVAMLPGDGTLLEADAYREPVADRWGEPPRIAVIYALGFVAMDEGMKARQLVEDIRAVTDDEGVKAVVLRVVSPGGEMMAADILADALRRCRDRKPLVVSQGYVAGSGGYSLSMHGDPILAAPNTVTGSIGVIGFWIYDTGLKSTLGLSTDRVQVGRHADLGFGMSLPLIGLQLPDRNLSESEKARMEKTIRTLYGDFVTDVATARNRNVEEIESVAQGRVWSGTHALSLGLVDQLGGLDDAVKIAAAKADIPPASPYRIVELPRQGLFDPSLLTPKIAFGLRQNQLQQSSALFDHLRFRLERNGQPLTLTPIDIPLIELGKIE